MHTNMVKIEDSAHQKHFCPSLLALHRADTVTDTCASALTAVTYLLVIRLDAVNTCRMYYLFTNVLKIVLQPYQSGENYSGKKPNTSNITVY